MRRVSSLFAVELLEQAVAHLIFDTSNGILATESCLGAFVEVCLSYLKTEILLKLLVL